MATITEILADAFRRVKTEHGVTLSRVGFAPGGDITFSAGSNSKVVGVVKRHLPDGLNWAENPFRAPKMPKPHGGDELVELPPESIEQLRMSLIREKAPESATHYGQYDATHDCYWKFKNRELCRWDLQLGWVQYTFGESAQSIVDQLTPLTSQSSSGSGS